MRVPDRPFPSLNLIGWMLLICGIIGFAASLILSIEKIHLLENPSASLSCSINPVINCGSVMKTGQAEVLGFPNSLIGIGMFAALAALGIALLAGARFRPWLWRLLQLGMLMGLGFVHWLFFQSLYEINSLCPFCMAVWVVTIFAGWYVTLYNLQQDPLFASLKIQRVAAFLARHHGDILLAWFLILSALILEHFWYYWQTLL